MQGGTRLFRAMAKIRSYSSLRYYYLCKSVARSSSTTTVAAATAAATVAVASTYLLQSHSQVAKAGEEEISESKYAMPSNPGLTRVVADTLEEICLSPTEDVFLYSFTKECQTCTKLMPVIKQLAKVFEDESHITIGIMDGDKNYKTGFFPSEVEEFYPILALYKASPSKTPSSSPMHKTKPVVFPGKSASCSQIVKFMHKNGVRFDLDKVLAKCKETQEETRMGLKMVVDQQLEEDLAKIFVEGPCSDEFKGLMLLSVYKTFSDWTDQDMSLQEELQSRRDACQSKDETYAYWDRVRNFAKGQLEDDE